MPAGVSWGEYLRFMTAALGSMFLGSQAVHLLYKPLQDMDQVLDQLRAVKQKQLASESSMAKQSEDSAGGRVAVNEENSTTSISETNNESPSGETQ